jgi:hypothetical protein
MSVKTPVMPKAFRLLALPLVIGAALAGCQSTQSRNDQLATICADPANRQPQSFYWGECQSLYPSSNEQLQQDYRLGAPGGMD